MCIKPPLKVDWPWCGTVCIGWSRLKYRSGQVAFAPCEYFVIKQRRTHSESKALVSLVFCPVPAMSTLLGIPWEKPYGVPNAIFQDGRVGLGLDVAAAFLHILFFQYIILHPWFKQPFFFSPFPSEFSYPRSTCDRLFYVVTKQTSVSTLNLSSRTPSLATALINDSHVYIACNDVMIQLHFHEHADRVERRFKQTKTTLHLLHSQATDVVFYSTFALSRSQIKCI